MDHHKKNSTPMVSASPWGDLIEYPYELTTRTADVITSKVMWNSVISTPNAGYACADVKHFYLNTPIDCYEYT